MTKKKLMIIVAISAATLILLYFGYRLFGVQINQPLRKELLQLPGVKQVEIIKARQGLPTVVQVTPKPTMDLAFFYHQVDGLIKGKFKAYELVIVNSGNRDAELLFDQMSLQFYGGLDRQDYKNMLQQMRETAKQQGWQVNMQMDATNIYVVMRKSEQIWYRVIVRYPSPLREEQSN